MKKRGFKIDLSRLLKIKPIKLKWVKLSPKASAITLCFTYLYIIAEIFYKVKIERISCTWEIILLFLIFSVYGILKKLFSNEELPCDHKGSPLPTGDSKKEKRRRNTFYKKSALIYSAIFAVISTIAFSCSSLLSNVNVSSQLFFDTELPNFILAVIISVIFLPIIYIFAYMIEYLWYEYKISVYNEIMAEKEEEENRRREILLKIQQEIEAEKSSEPPKRRGRPRKVVNEEIKEPTETAPKRRGRPPKKKVEETENP